MENKYAFFPRGKMHLRIPYRPEEPRRICGTCPEKTDAMGGRSLYLLPQSSLRLRKSAVVLALSATCLSAAEEVPVTICLAGPLRGLLLRHYLVAEGGNLLPDTLAQTDLGLLPPPERGADRNMQHTLTERAVQYPTLRRTHDRRQSAP